MKIARINQRYELDKNGFFWEWKLGRSYDGNTKRRYTCRDIPPCNFSLSCSIGEDSMYAESHHHREIADVIGINGSNFYHGAAYKAWCRLWDDKEFKKALHEDNSPLVEKKINSFGSPDEFGSYSYTGSGRYLFKPADPKEYPQFAELFKRFNLVFQNTIQYFRQGALPSKSKRDADRLLKPKVEGLFEFAFSLGIPKMPKAPNMHPGEGTSGEWLEKNLKRLSHPQEYIEAIRFVREHLTPEELERLKRRDARENITGMLRKLYASLAKVASGWFLE